MIGKIPQPAIMKKVPGRYDNIRKVIEYYDTFDQLNAPPANSPGVDILPLTDVMDYYLDNAEYWEDYHNTYQENIEGIIEYRDGTTQELPRPVRHIGTIGRAVGFDYPAGTPVFSPVMDGKAIYGPLSSSRSEAIAVGGSYDFPPTSVIYDDGKKLIFYQERYWQRVLVAAWNFYTTNLPTSLTPYCDEIGPGDYAVDLSSINPRFMWMCAAYDINKDIPLHDHFTPGFTQPAIPISSREIFHYGNYYDLHSAASIDCAEYSRRSFDYPSCSFPYSEERIRERFIWWYYNTMDKDPYKGLFRYYGDWYYGGIETGNAGRQAWGMVIEYGGDSASRPQTFMPPIRLDGARSKARGVASPTSLLLVGQLGLRLSKSRSL